MTITTVHLLDDNYAIKHEDGTNVRASRNHISWYQFPDNRPMKLLMLRHARMEELLRAVAEHVTSSDNDDYPTGINTIQAVKDFLNEST